MSSGEPDTTPEDGPGSPGCRDGDIDALARAAMAPVAELGPFDLLHEAGRGGQGVVYKARRRADGRVVAVKRLTAARRTSDRLRARFEREWEAARRLDHPGIVRQLDIEVVREEMMIAMEWVEGVAITRWADDGPDGRRREPRACVAAMVAVVEAVVHAHQRGVIHRDLKPSNILVGPGDRPRILDFGLARLLEPGDVGQEGPSLTGPDEAIGTIPYAAPEQILGGASQADTRADVYALGAVLYRMLTGRPPHRTDGPLEEVLRALHDNPPRPSSLNPAVDRALDAVVLRALRRAPGERYQSANALGDDLGRYLAGDPVQATPPRLSDHLRGIIRRHRAASASAAGLLAGVLVFGAVSTVLALRLADERTSALHSAAQARHAAEESAVALDAVRDLLASARPTQAGGDATVLGLLERAADLTSTRLANHPAAAAELAYTVGYTYRSLWMWRESIPHLERALQLSASTHGAEDEATIRCMVALGTSLSNLGDGRAIELQREALRLRRASDPPDPGLVSESLMRLGYALHRATPTPAWDEAESSLRAALHMRRDAFGARSHAAAECLHHLAYLSWRQRRGPEAVALYREALEVFHDSGSAGGPAYAECLTGLAAILNQTGEHAAAIDAYRELIPITRDLFGRPQTIPQLLQFADSLEASGQSRAAAEAYSEAASLRCSTLLTDEPAAPMPLARVIGALAASAEGATELAQALRALPIESLLQLEPALRGMARCWRAEGHSLEAAVLDGALSLTE